LYPTEEAGRQKVTLTLEQFKADKWGSWFYFVDVDMSRRFTESAYTERMPCLHHIRSPHPEAAAWREHHRDQRRSQGEDSEEIIQNEIS
ncbi:MAG: DUF5020 family protein, partial [Prevotella sp.]|nr:DUF5020 family protein [Prevotella sp.]